jgi:predicted RNA-binding protein with PUA-like domain
MNYWMLKSEPSSFAIDDLARLPRQTASWDGVRNFQARNMLRDLFKKGDAAFFYHSSCLTPGIVGTAKIVRSGYPDATAFDRKHRHYDADSDVKKPRWFTVDVKLTRKFSRVITLEELRALAAKELAELVVLRRGNRLSVMPVTKTEWDFIHRLE